METWFRGLLRKLRAPQCSSVSLHPLSHSLPNSWCSSQTSFQPFSIPCFPLSIAPSVSQSVQSLIYVQLFSTPWTAAHQASLSITNSQSLRKLMSIESVMPSDHLILCHALLPPSIFPSIRVFSNGSVLHIRWPKNWSFSSSISPSNEYAGLISFRMDWLAP